MTVDTFFCGLLHGETDTSGYPDYTAIVGGLASHWDELSGELIVRAVVGWGGKGQRGDTDRIASAARARSTSRSSRRGTAWARRSRRGSRGRRAFRPGLRALRLRGGERRRVLLPEVRHADEPDLTRGNK